VLWDTSAAAAMSRMVVTGRRAADGAVGADGADGADGSVCPGASSGIDP
jgi:hypothetical protein